MPEEDLLERVNKREWLDLNNELRLSYQTEVTGDGPTLQTEGHLGCDKGCTARLQLKNRRPPPQSTY